MVAVRSLLMAVIAALAVWSAPAAAHEVRPAYLEFTEVGAQQLRVTWKRPTAGDLALPLRPHLSSGLLDGAPGTVDREAGSITSVWTLPVALQSLDRQTLEIGGLARSITDVLVVVRPADGETTTLLLRPDAPSTVLDTAAPVWSLPAYLGMGVHHIWGGYDHLLFVLGLMFLVRDGRKLLWTVTAFTLAHSLTLSAAALGLVRVPIAPVEAVIAISIVFVAVEAVRLRQGRAGLSARFPWIVAFLFGLLHGLGFASALREVGLPQRSVASALLLFNVGIEIGQVTFVLAVLLLQRVLARRQPWLRAKLDLVVPHFIGCLAAFWAIERTVSAF